jgi:hypothetical protein
VAGGSNIKYLWFDRELRHLDNKKTKAHKFMKEMVNMVTEAENRFRNLRQDLIRLRLQMRLQIDHI